MLEHFSFNEMRDMRKVLSEMRRNSIKQLYNQLKLAERNDVEEMENVFFDTFENEEKVDNRTMADFHDGYYTITQNIEKLSDNGVVLSTEIPVGAEIHQDDATLAIYYEADGIIYISFYIDGVKKGSYELEGTKPHINSENKSFKIVYLKEDEGYGVQQAYYLTLDPFGASEEDSGNFIATQTNHNKEDPFYIAASNTYVFKSNYDDKNRLEYYNGRILQLLDHSSEILDIQGIKAKDRTIVFFTDMENGVEQLCFIDTGEKKVHRLTEDVKTEKGFHLIEKDGDIYIFSLCEEGNYLNLKQTKIEITLPETSKDDPEFNITRETITQNNEDLNKGVVTIDKAGRFTHYYLVNDILTVAYENETYTIEGVDNFNASVYPYQNLYINDGSLMLYKFDELFTDDDELYVHTPEKNSKVYSVDIRDTDKFNTIHLYLYRDDSPLKIKPKVNFRDSGEVFYDFKLVETKEKTDYTEEYYSITIEDSTRFNLVFELLIDNKFDEGKFLGYGVTFI